MNKFLLAEGKFISKVHIRQPELMCSPCRPFTKNKERIQKFKEAGNSKYICQNELDKASFQHDMSYRDFKGLPRRSAAVGYYVIYFINFMIKILQVVLLKMKLYPTFRLNRVLQTKQKNYINKLLVNSKSENYTHLIENIESAELADMQLINKINKGIRFYYLLLIFIGHIHGLFF